MDTVDLFAAAGVSRGACRVVEQAFRYERGRAVAYRCPDCGELHPLNPRDWDEERGVYAGRDCGAGPLRIVAVRAKHAAYRRVYYATHPEYRERERERQRVSARARRALATR